MTLENTSAIVFNSCVLLDLYLCGETRNYWSQCNLHTYDPPCPICCYNNCGFPVCYEPGYCACPTCNYPDYEY
ncbi:UNVERIFIED_CONTAM: hypothetical protein RMT77_005493 [Armadillidium vulgare]